MQADLRLCWSHIRHCWKSHVTAQIYYILSKPRTQSRTFAYMINSWYWGGGGGGGGPDWTPCPLRAWDRAMYTLIEIYSKPILSCASAFVLHFAYFLSHAQFFKLTKHLSCGSDLDPNRFCNLNRERKRERLVHAHPFGKIIVHRQIDK